jgi:hypothetical protein
MSLAGKPRIGRRLHSMEGCQLRFSRRVEIGLGRYDDPARPATGAAPADTRVRDVVRAADLEHRHPDTSNRGQAAIVGHHHARAPPSQNVDDEYTHRQGDGSAIQQEDRALDDIQTMPHFLADLQVLLN